MKDEQKLIKCGVCGKHPEIILENGEYVFKDAFVEHHTSYEKNITVKVCQSCNIKIGKNPEKYPKFLVPEQPRKNFVKARKRRKHTVRHLILITLMKREHCLEPELITKVAQKSDVKEATVRRELSRLLREKLVEMTYKILPRNGRAPVYSIVQSKKTRRKVKPNNNHEQRALSEYS